ncbi:hypothetical protein AB0R98_04060 [Erwinia amylovora]
MLEAIAAALLEKYLAKAWLAGAGSGHSFIVFQPGWYKGSCP